MVFVNFLLTNRIMILPIRLLLLFLIVSFFSSSQGKFVRGIAIDDTGQPIVSAEVINYKGRHVTATDSLGCFSFQGEVGVKYALVKAEFELTWFIAQSSEGLLRIKMKNNVQEIQSVVITRKGSEEALDVENVNIIDYRPLQGYILTLKKKKDRYYIGIDSLNTEGLSIPIFIEKPRELYYDCMHNTFVLNKDSAYQFVILDGTMDYISKMSIVSFNTYIRPCVADFGESLVLSKLSKHNKEYSLTKYKNGQGNTFFTRIDSIAYQVAREDALMIGQQNQNDLAGDSLNDNLLYRRQKIREINNGENPDVNLLMLENSTMQDHLQKAESLTPNERMLLNQQISHSSYDNSASKWGQLQASYMLRSQPIKIRSFQIGQYIASVDFDADSVILFDHDGRRVQSRKFIIPSDTKDVWQDLASGFLFLYTKDHGNHKVFSLNARTGEVNYLKNFREVPHIKSGLVYDNWLYYSFIENGYYGVRRVKLPEQSFE